MSANHWAHAFDLQSLFVVKDTLMPADKFLGSWICCLTHSRDRFSQPAYGRDHEARIGIISNIIVEAMQL